ncbi:MAG: RidA family protein [Anaerolineae bacterium]|nr:RidA family protein [Anaerolineae bacterium]
MSASTVGSSDRQVVFTDQAPKAVGPYSQGIIMNGFVFTAGQIALDPTTQQMIEGGIEEQTRRVLSNMRAILEAAGTSLDHVVKTTVFLADLGDFAAMNKVYAEFFPHNPPARSTIGGAQLPRNSRVEIECIAAL